jgi:hypothetical protein
VDGGGANPTSGGGKEGIDEDEFEDKNIFAMLMN